MEAYHAYATADRLAMAKSSVDRALALQPDLPETHLALGYYYYWGLRDYDKALEALNAETYHDKARYISRRRRRGHSGTRPVQPRQ